MGSYLTQSCHIITINLLRTQSERREVADLDQSKIKSNVGPIKMRM